MTDLLHWQNDKLANIRRIASIEELEGYETEARRRGLFPGETAALMQRRIEIAALMQRRIKLQAR